MTTNNLPWPVILGVSKRQMPAANWVDLSRKSHEELLGYYRNTAIAHHRQHTAGDTNLDPNALAAGSLLLYREILRRLIRAPASPTGVDDMAAAVVTEPPPLTQAREPRAHSAPKAHSPVAPRRVRSRGWEM